MNCGKSFYPINDFIGKYQRKSKMLVGYVVWNSYACNSLDKIRIEFQSSLPKSRREYFKHSRYLLLSRICNIKENRYDELEDMLINYFENLVLLIEVKIVFRFLFKFPIE